MTAGDDRRGRWPDRPPRLVVSVVVALVIAGVGAFLLVGDGPGPPPDGTRTTADVADEVPEGVVLAGARDVESTVARLGDSLSIAVTYTVDGKPDDVLLDIERGLGTDWVRRSASSDDQVRQSTLDGPGDAVLTITVRVLTNGSGVGAALTQG